MSTNKMDVKQLRIMANTVRQDVIRMIAEAKSGHPAGSLGMTDVLVTLYFSFLKVRPKKPKDPERDYLVLSNGHICPALYAVMANRGFFPKKELMNLRKIGSRLQGHPHREALPGLESSSGPLGCGLSQAAGMALGLKMSGKKNRVVCLTSDGEHEEGNTWEAVMFAAKYGLDNLIQIMDRNNIQIDGTTDEVMPLRSLKKKYEAFNWSVIEINAHDIKQILKALEQADKTKAKPTIIIAKTIPGKGVSFMENDYKWHGKAPSREQAEKAIEELKKERLRIR
ncbi:transketolase [Candidatus Woesearchaeota archaeon]|nr:MAG: transketolase [Candidatus Woesearchaeota archaeon]